MRLDELIAPEASAASTAAEITGLTYDSRTVRAGDLLFCVSGFRHDGHEFAAQAVDRGAAALVVERPLGLGVPEVVVDSVRAAMGPIAARFYGDPSAELQVVGATGTNGKTTTAYLVRALFEAIGEQCGLLGTVKSVVGAVERPVTRTTPEAIDLQADFRAMLDGGDRACAMEVSSHALALGRADGHSLRGGGVHQHQPRSSRLPRDDGGLLPGQAAAVRGGRGFPAGRERGEHGRLSTDGGSPRSSTVP